MINKDTIISRVLRVDEKEEEGKKSDRNQCLQQARTTVAGEAKINVKKIEVNFGLL